MKLISTVLHLGQSRMEVIVEDRLGKRRRIAYSWLSKEKTNSPPVFWSDIVEQEVEYQIQKESEIAEGKHIPLDGKLPWENK